jgi:CRP/FNR family transcriptional regulator, cyclic AMP receptor protein
MRTAESRPSAPAGSYATLRPMVGASRGKASAALAASMAATPILTGTNKHGIVALAEAGVVHNYRRGTYIFHQGDPAADLHFLVEGRVEISSDSVTGQRQLHTTLDPPAFFGELGVLGDLPRTATALTLEDTRVWVVGGDVWMDFVAENPDVSRALLRALARQVQAHEAFVEDLLFLDLKGRVAKRLLQLVAPSDDDLPKNGAALLPSVVTHADLASLSGGSRENVTRILSEFQRRGLIAKEDRRYRLKNIDGLRKLAQL